MVYFNRLEYVIKTFTFSFCSKDITGSDKANVD